MRRGGGGKVAVNPEQVTHVRSAAGAFTDIFFEGHQVAVEGTFVEVVDRLYTAGRGTSERDQRDAHGERRGGRWSDIVLARILLRDRHSATGSHLSSSIRPRASSPHAERRRPHGPAPRDLNAGRVSGCGPESPWIDGVWRLGHSSAKTEPAF